MKNLKLFLGIFLCAFLLASSSSFAQNGIRPGGPGSQKVPKGTPPGQTYTTAKKFTTLVLSNAKAGDVVRYHVAGGATKTVSLPAGQTTARAAICNENSKGLSISYSFTNQKAKVTFSDSDTCPVAANGSNIKNP